MIKMTKKFIQWINKYKMDSTSLYDLPKDMLIKLIVTLQDVKNLNDDQLLNNIELSMKQMEERKTIRIKEILLLTLGQFNKPLENNDYINIITSIQVMKLRHFEDMSTSSLNICFSNGIQISAYVGPNSTVSNLYNGSKYIYFIDGKNGADWLLAVEEEYNIYVKFICDILYDNFISLNYYLNPLVSVESNLKLK
jgi:hypothetical protein